MALIAVLEFGNNNIGRYHKQYLVSDCHFVHKRPYNRFCPEAPVRSELLEVSVICSDHRGPDRRTVHNIQRGNIRN